MISAPLQNCTKPSPSALYALYIQCWTTFIGMVTDIAFVACKVQFGLGQFLTWIENWMGYSILLWSVRNRKGQTWDDESTVQTINFSLMLGYTMDESSQSVLFSRYSAAFIWSLKIHSFIMLLEAENAIEEFSGLFTNQQFNDTCKRKLRGWFFTKRYVLVQYIWSHGSQCRCFAFKYHGHVVKVRHKRTHTWRVWRALQRRKSILRCW